MYSNFRTRLISLSDDDYREFSMRGIPCDRPFLGVRIPDIRRLVKDIPLEVLDDFLAESPVAFEEVIARGFAIARLPYPEILKHFNSQLTYLDNWCTVDTFCAALRKPIKTHAQDFFETKIEHLLLNKGEFVVRAGLVCLLDFYVQPDFLQVIFDRAETLKSREEYYIRMALAWLLAECYIKYPDETFSYLSNSELDKWTLNKTVSKICDSHRVDTELKERARELRKNML